MREGYWMVVMIRKHGLEGKAPHVYHEMARLLASQGFLKEEWPNHAWDQVDCPDSSKDSPHRH
jgi:hypothetical protein